MDIFMLIFIICLFINGIYIFLKSFPKREIKIVEEEIIEFVDASLSNNHD